MDRCSILVSIFVLVIVCWTQYSWGYETVTSGNGNGELCGNKTCAPEATCTVNETCKCVTSPYVNGNGYLKCYTDQEYGTYLANDPVVSTWDEVKANLVVPCRFQQTTLTTNLYLSGALGGFCSADIRPFNAKDKGKFFVWGFDAAIRIFFLTGAVWQFSVQKYGLAENGTYTYKIRAMNGLYNVDGPFGTDTFVLTEPTTGLELAQCYMDTDYNFAVINLTYCGLCIRFRAYDWVIRRESTMTPGLMVVVDKANIPNFLNDAKSLALMPAGTFNAKPFTELPYQNISKPASILAYYLETSPQIPQFFNEECITAGDAYANCTTAEGENVFTYCLWMLTSPKFVRCYDTSFTGVNIMGLFRLCIQHYCNGETECSSIQSLLTNSGCSSHDPSNTMLSTFISGCPT